MSLKSDIAAKRSTRVLYLEANDDDRNLAERALKREGIDCEFQFAASQREFEQAICRGEFDLILSDCSIPSYEGKLALGAARKFQPETPFIVLSGTMGEESVVEFLKAGAADYVLKKRIDHLGPAARRALREAEERRGRRGAEEALRVQTSQLRALAARAQASREEEQIRISREIHDELGEALTAQKFGLEWIRQRLCGDPIPRDQLLEKVESLKALADTTAKRVRELCTELRPPILDDLGLIAAIEWQADEFQRRTSIRCEVIHDLEDLNLNGAQATAMFRIFQEILTNAARHSSASKVRVELTRAAGRLQLEAKDNGRGISEAKIQSGGSLGLLGMRERALSVGGDVCIEGVPGKGTTVTVSVPLEASAHDAAGSLAL